MTHARTLGLLFCMMASLFTASAHAGEELGIPAENLKRAAAGILAYPAFYTVGKYVTTAWRMGVDNANLIYGIRAEGLATTSGLLSLTTYFAPVAIIEALHYFTDAFVLEAARDVTFSSGVTLDQKDAIIKNAFEQKQRSLKVCGLKLALATLVIAGTAYLLPGENSALNATMFGGYLSGLFLWHAGKQFMQITR